MKKIILLAIGFILFQTIHAQETASINWNNDLEYLKKALPEKHYNFFATRSSKEFSDGIDAIKSESRSLTDLQIALKAQQLIAKFGDSHTLLDFTSLIDKNQLLPLNLLWAQDKLYVLQTTQQNQEILGCQLTAINTIPIATVIDSISTLFTIDNRAILKAQIPYFIPYIDILKFFGFAQDGQITLSLKTSDNQDLSYKMKPTDMEKDKLVYFEPDSMSLCVRNKNVLFTDSYDSDNKIYYMIYNKCWSRELEIEYGTKENAEKTPSFKEFEKEAFTILNTKPVDKIIFDLRYNGGGNSLQGTAFITNLASFLKTHPQIKTYVVIGRNTFSSAILNAMDFKKLTNAIFIGEETAGKPNHFGEVRSFELPDSKVQVNYSTKYFKRADEDVNTLVPDVALEASFSDFTKGIDPVYEWVKKQ